MSTVIYAINITVDGCCDHTKGILPTEEMMDYYTGLWQDVDLIVWGRKIYELMVPYWPDVAAQQSGTPGENAFAKRLTEIDKVVFSRTLKPENVEPTTKIVSGDLREEFLKIKQSGSKRISLGGVTLPSQLITLGLVDEFHFIIHPVIAGAGTRLMQATEAMEMQNLTLAETKLFGSGALALHYVKQGIGSGV